MSLYQGLGAANTNNGPPLRRVASEGNRPSSRASSFTYGYMGEQDPPNEDDLPSDYPDEDTEVTGLSMLDRPPRLDRRNVPSAGRTSSTQQARGSTAVRPFVTTSINVMDNVTSTSNSNMSGNIKWGSSPNPNAGVQSAFEVLQTKEERHESATKASQSKNRHYLFAAATAADSDHQFGLQGHLMSTTIPSENADSKTSEKIEDGLVDNTRTLNVIAEHAERYDFKAITNVPNLIDESGSTPLQMWGAVYTCMFLMWESVKYNQVLLWQKTLNTWITPDNPDYTSNKWALIYFRNCCTTSLLDRIDRKYKALPIIQQGPATFLFILLKTVFWTSRDTISSMRSYLSTIERKGLYLFQGESVIRFADHVEVVVRRLFACNSLPNDTWLMVLKGLSKTSHKGFRALVLQLLNTEQLANIGLSYDNQYSFGNAQELSKTLSGLEMFIDWYTNSVNTGQWLSVDMPGRAANALVDYIKTCFNCDKQGHMLSECPEPRDEATIKKNWEAFKKANPRTNKKSGSDGGGAGKSWENKRPSNKVIVKDGTALAHCSKCNRYNSTHSTNFHDQWSSDKKAFKLASNHPLAIKQKKLAAARKQGTSSSSSALVASGPPQDGMVLVNRNQATAELERLERSSTNPDTATLVGALRTALSLN